MKREKQIGAVLLAAGSSRRYEGIKLLDWIEGKKMYQYALELAAGLQGAAKVIVTGYEEIRREAEALNIKAVWNDRPELGISKSLQLGLEEVLKEKKEIDGVLFLVCDQPWLSAATVEGMIQAFCQGEKGILCPVCTDGGLEEFGNPCIIGREYFEELFMLEGDRGGKKVICCHKEDIEVFYVEEKQELTDIDTRI